MKPDTDEDVKYKAIVAGIFIILDSIITAILFIVFITHIIK